MCAYKEGGMPLHWLLLLWEILQNVDHVLVGLSAPFCSADMQFYLKVFLVLCDCSAGAEDR